MHLLIYILVDSTHILKKIPVDEFSMKLGEVVEIDGKKYSVLNIETEEFLSYELIVHTISVAEFKEDKNGFY